MERLERRLWIVLGIAGFVVALSVLDDINRTLRQANAAALSSAVARLTAVVEALPTRFAPAPGPQCDCEEQLGAVETQIVTIGRRLRELELNATGRSFQRPLATLLTLIGLGAIGLAFALFGAFGLVFASSWPTALRVAATAGGLSLLTVSTLSLLPIENVVRVDNVEHLIEFGRTQAGATEANVRWVLVDKVGPFPDGSGELDEGREKAAATTIGSRLRSECRRGHFVSFMLVGSADRRKLRSTHTYQSNRVLAEARAEAVKALIGTKLDRPTPIALAVSGPLNLAADERVEALAEDRFVTVWGLCSEPAAAVTRAAIPERAVAPPAHSFGGGGFSSGGGGGW